NQGKAWGMLDRNPAVGVKLPRKRAVKAPVLLSLAEIRRMIEVVKEPTKSLIMLIVFASMRPGEALALRWKDILRDRIVVDERVYDDEFDEVKTDAGKREVPFDKHGVLLAAVQQMWATNKNFRKPDDLVFANKVGKEVARDNMGHAGSSGSITLDVYSKTWWSERVEAVSRVVEAVFAEPDEEERKENPVPLKGLPGSGIGLDWEPSWEPQAV